MFVPISTREEQSLGRKPGRSNSEVVNRASTMKKRTRLALRDPLSKSRFRNQAGEEISEALIITWDPPGGAKEQGWVSSHNQTKRKSLGVGRRESYGLSASV